MLCHCFRNVFVCLLVALCFATGCEDKRPIASKSSPAQAGGATKNEAQQSSILLDHPEYANWSRFPVGASVTRKRVVTNEFGEVQVTTKMWLEDKSKTEVAVGSQVSVVRSDNPPENNPPSSTTYPAQFSPPTGMKPELFLLPSGKAKLVGEEKVSIGEVEVTAEVYEWTENNEAGQMTVKLWRSEEIPGRIVRQEMLTESSSTRTIEQIGELDLKGQ
ncbi:MAG: hypothetical protein FJ308_06905 [Planctomycetes bacterium]|nr:hypothetical protein [Planctomycetota bacterium]